MNNKITKLLDKLNNQANEMEGIKIDLQDEYNKVFDSMPQVKEMVAKLEQSNNYTIDKYGEIASIESVNLSDFQECGAYFVDYMRDNHYITIDLDNGYMTYSQGPDCMIIQDDTRHDNGVWLEGKLVIKESEYKEDGDVDELKRNELIEAYMEKTGYFPGVFRVDAYGNVFLVDIHSKS